MKNRGKATGLMNVHLAVLFFGLAGLFGKLLPLPSPLIVLGRVFFASLTLFIIMALTGRSFKLDEKADYIWLIICGMILALHWGTFFQAIQVSTVAVGLLTYSTFPIFVTFLEPLFFKDRLRWFDILMAMLTFTGVTLVIPRFQLGDNVFIGALWGIASGFTFAILSILNRKYVARYSSLLIALYEDFIAFLVLLPALFIYQPLFHTRDILLLVLLGIVFTGIAHSLFIKGMSHIKAQLASLIASLEPVYGITFAIFIIGEIPTLRVIAGGVLILGASSLASIKSGSAPPLPE